MEDERREGRSISLISKASTKVLRTDKTEIFVCLNREQSRIYHNVLHAQSSKIVGDSLTNSVMFLKLSFRRT